MLFVVGLLSSLSLVGISSLAVQQNSWAAV